MGGFDLIDFTCKCIDFHEEESFTLQKDKLQFIGRSDSNSSVFYVGNGAGLSNTLVSHKSVHAHVSRGGALVQ